MNARKGTNIALLIAFTSVASAQQCPVTSDVATYPNPPLTYPMTSNRYAVQYKLGSAANWTDAQVSISYYGGTTSSPYIQASRYPPDTSMSFASIPASPGTAVMLRVTKLWGSAFPAVNHVSVRPHAKGIHLDSVSGNALQLSTNTAPDFAGDQFILWWDGDTQQSSAIQGLAFFLNPPYDRPSGSTVKIIATPADLAGDLSRFETLDFEGTVAVGGTGAQAFIVPANIANVFLGPSAWVQGKLRFAQSGAGHMRRTYGPGVLDVSRFGYMWRQCRNSTTHTADGYQSVSWIPLPSGTNANLADRFVLDGPIIADSNYYATDHLTNATVNNTKLIGWNGNNDGFQFGVTARASNVFVRTGDDSLKMWGSYITVTNATVWQNWNGGVINLGWFDNSPGDDCLIDGVYVVKTDWHTPVTPSWSATALNGQNNAIVASLMVPTSKFGTLLPSVYRNIYVEDAPRVLFSLKILPPDCALVGLAMCPVVDFSQLSFLNVNIENVFSPASIVENSIGFQTVNGSNLVGTMNIGLTNVMLTLPNGTVTPLTGANSVTVGDLTTNGNNVNVVYASVPNATTPPQVPSGAVGNAASGAPATPGGLASVYGSNFGSSAAGVTVLIGGIVAPLFYVSPQQINFQVPWQLGGQTQAALSVTSGDMTGAPIMVPLASQAPGIFLLNSAGQAAVLIANTATIAAPVGTYPVSRPAQQGEFISIFCTGLGSVTHQPATGAPAAADPLSLTDTGPVSVSIGGTPATSVLFSGLAPGFVGLYQVNVQVPANSPTGAAVPVTIRMGTTTSNQATIAVAPAN